MPDFELRAALSPIFSVPLIRHRWPQSEDLNNALADLFLAEERTEAGITRSNVGGWHSDEGIFARDDAALGQLRARILLILRRLLADNAQPREDSRVQFGLSGWANVTRPGGYNCAHDHGDFDWAGVYYVTAGDPPDAAAPLSGLFEFIDPRAGASGTTLAGQCFAPNWRIQPEPGLMLIFPGWLKHLVHPYRGTAPRISIAFNITLRPESRQALRRL
mgnify:CR=1 FL=1